MRLLLIILALLLAAIYVGSISLNDSGYIIIGYQGQVLRTSFIFFALVIILAGILLYFLVRVLANLFATPEKVSDWNHHRLEKKAQKSLSKGFAALAEGNWATAERSLSHDATISKRLSYVHYLGAAQAAQSQGKIVERDDYLLQAEKSAPGNDTAVGITRAELQIKHGQTDQARETLEGLLSAHPNHHRVLKLLAELHQSKGEWRSLQTLLKRLNKTGAVNNQELQQLEKDTWIGLLDEYSNNTAVLKDTWSRMPKKLQKEPDLLYRFLTKLSHSDSSSDALPLLEKSLNSQWDDRLIELYGECQGANPAKQLEQAERWLPANPESHHLLSVLGGLSFRNELWGKAKNYLQTAIEFGAGPKIYNLLAETLEQMGETEAAGDYRKKGLELATNGSRALVKIKNPEPE
jgi:HemY protein